MIIDHGTSSALTQPFWPENNQEAQIKMDMTNASETIDYIRGIWEENFPEYLFEYTFLDEFLKGLYENEARLLTMIQGASFLAILIGCLGLLGLAAFIAEQRTKEIGIRKVLGASGVGIVGMISKDFLAMILISIVVAWPAAYFGSLRWLQQFAYRSAIGWWIFAAAGLTGLLIVLCTVGLQAVKSANTNPVDTLRYE